MKRASDKILGYTGANPFRESQARSGSAAEIVSEFFPTSTFWSLFNHQHEILLGTRGSGKTYLLRMMSYSLLRKFEHATAREHVKNASFIGFYVPLHLEFLASLAGKHCADDNRLGYFQFAFNCAAAKALLTEVKSLLKDRFSDSTERLLAEARIIRLCSSIWFPTLKNGDTTTISDLQFAIESIYATTPFWSDDDVQSVPIPLGRNILAPIVSILPKLSEAFNLDPDRTQWVALIDEAEFVSAPFLKCINTFLRSEKRPLVVKIATLPFKHSTRETISNDVTIEPRGNDFAYVLVDLPWDSIDFRGLADHICAKRLARSQCPADTDLEAFLGKVGENDDLVDYFKLEMGEEAASREALLKGILAALSEVRQHNFQDIRDELSKVDRPYKNRFAPVYFARIMRLENKRGGRVAAWFAGAKTVRRISDGNPRRFIQIMSDLFEKARDEKLTPKAQHRIISDFCERYLEDVEGYPECGPLLRGLVDSVGQLLSSRIHGPHMVDGGCNFKIDSRLLGLRVFRETVEFGIAYSIFLADSETVQGKLDETSDLRLSFVFAVSYWLPMRKGDPVILRSKHTSLPGVEPDSKANTKKSRDTIDSFQLELFETDDE
jgi:hypothetical protein